MTRPFELEVCVDRIDDAIAAVDAGATRIEMNSGLQCSGLTPSIASCRWLADHCSVPVVAMLRPHDDGFVYTAAEKTVLLRDAQLLLDAGVHGLVYGALGLDGRLDLDSIAAVVGLCGNRELIVHRAFDELDDQLAALNQLVDCGATRILTSGGAITALTGAKQLRSLIELADDRIEILPGAGVRSSNVIELIDATNGNQVHGSFRHSDRSRSGPDVDDIRRTRRLLEGKLARPEQTEGRIPQA